MIDRERMMGIYLAHGQDCSANIEDLLGVQDASIVHPGDLAAIGYSVFASAPDDRFRHDNPQICAENALSLHTNPKYSDQSILANLRRFHPQELTTRYAELIGKNDYSEGEIARALRQASPDLQISLGELFAYFVMANPTKTPPTTIDLIPSQKTLIYPEGENHLIGLVHELSKKPEIVVHYGAGLGVIGRMKEEIGETEQTVLIDKGLFIGSALNTAAEEQGFEEPKVVVNALGIKSATQQLKSEGYALNVDLITMAMVHAAGMREIEAGIRNGYALLRPGGALAIQVVSPVLEDQADGVEVYRMIGQQFGNPVAAEKFTYQHPVLKERRFGLQAVFLK